MVSPRHMELHWHLACSYSKQMAVRFDFDPTTPLARSVFVRCGERMVIEGVTTTEILVSFGNTTPQPMKFEDPLDAVFFQNNLESELVRKGWTLVAFESARPDPRPSAAAAAW
jgi:hypothetical protein